MARTGYACRHCSPSADRRRPLMTALPKELHTIGALARQGAAYPAPAFRRRNGRCGSGTDEEPQPRRHLWRRNEAAKGRRAKMALTRDVRMARRRCEDALRAALEPSEADRLTTTTPASIATTHVGASPSSSGPVTFHFSSSAVHSVACISARRRSRYWTPRRRIRSYACAVADPPRKRVAADRLQGYARTHGNHPSAT